MEKNDKQNQSGKNIDADLIKKRASKKGPDLDYILQHRHEIENNPYLLILAQQIADLVSADGGFQKFLNDLEKS